MLDYVFCVIQGLVDIKKGGCLWSLSSKEEAVMVTL